MVIQKKNIRKKMKIITINKERKILEIIRIKRINDPQKESMKRNGQLKQITRKIKKRVRKKKIKIRNKKMTNKL